VSDIIKTEVEIMDEFLKDIYTSVFKEWVKHYDYHNMKMQYDENTVFIQTKYSESEIRFNNLNIIELQVTNTLNNENEFYLHFQMKTLKHALDLFNEMISVIKNLIHKPKLKILLSCSSGLTTSYFAENLNEASHVLHLDYHFDAIGYSQLNNKANDYDMILLAPQIAYEHAHVQELYANKVVLKIPSSVFAKYNCGEMLSIIRNTQEIKKKTENKPLVLKEIVREHDEILTLILIRNSARVHVGYRLFGKNNEILEDNEIIKNNITLEDIFDVIDTILLTHHHIEVIGIATPGIINDGIVDKTCIHGLDLMNMSEEFQKKYKQKLVLCNDVNSFAVGYHACQSKYHNISVLFQPVSAYSGVGHIINDELLVGRCSLAGEIQYQPLELSKSKLELNKTVEGTYELISQTIISMISMVGPELIVVASSLLSSVERLRNIIKQTIPEKYIPDIVQMDYVQDYSFIGNLILCIRELYS
jgi:cellobiose-specific phosphotransferase system component IIB